MVLLPDAYDQILRAEIRRFRRRHWSMRQLAAHYKVSELGMARKMRRLGLFPAKTKQLQLRRVTCEGPERGS